MRAASATLLALLLAAVPLASGCSQKEKQGLPPAESWDQASAGGVVASLDQAQRPRSTGERSSNPHAGVPGAPPLDDDGGGGGDNPHAGLDMGGAGDPHAGLDMGGGMGGMGMPGMGSPGMGGPGMGSPGMGGAGSDPHAGLDMGGGGGGNIDVTQLGLPPPDPARRIDPSRRVKGMLRASPKVKDRMKAGGAVFLVVRRAGTDGQPTGSPLAVEKLMWSGDGVPFELTEANAMSAGTELFGDVVVMVRYDQDSDAITKQPGDVTGQARTKVPADKLDVTLDTILP